jgi:hypothetical protein
MRFINHKIEGDARIEEDMEFSGIVNGNLVVASGATLHLRGIVNGNLALEPSSRVELHGIVNGGVENRGGHLEVWGIVNGGLSRQAGTTIVHPKAIVD